MSVTPSRVDWEPDILPGFERASVDGVTVVRPTGDLTTAPRKARALVLHVHGRNDYFFQTHEADAFRDAGYDFAAVDMRRAGRSWRQGEDAHHVMSMAELGEDIETAIGVLVGDNSEIPVVIHAHSTGALAAASWAVHGGHPNLTAMVLNSPLFGIRLGWRERFGARIAPRLARRRPTLALANPPATYALYQHHSHGGRWDFDTTWKRPEGVPVTAGWIAAVGSAVRELRAGVTMPCPVLIARSDASGPERADNPLLDSQDTVVDVDATAELAQCIRGAELLTIPGGVHDLTLSAPEPRALYFEEVLAWLDTVVA